jgi:hypothetical protein
LGSELSARVLDLRAQQSRKLGDFARKPSPPPTRPSASPALPGLRSAFAVGLGLTAVKVILHLWLIECYSHHRDELYFIECGKRLALGYVDHAPLAPWVAAASSHNCSACALALTNISPFTASAAAAR